MSVSLLEVIEAGGYDLATRDDANWLLSKRDEFDELVEQAEEVVEAQERAITEQLEAHYKSKFGGDDE